MQVEADDDPMKTPSPDGRRWILEALERHERPLVRYVQRRLGDPEAARDAVQEAYLRLCRADPPPIGEHVRAWLFRVCRNLAIDHLRKEGRMHALDTPVADTADRSAPDARLARADDAARLRSWVAELPPPQQEVLRLRFEDALSYKEIAVVTGSSINHVGVLLHRALIALRARQARTPEAAAHERRSS